MKAKFCIKKMEKLINEIISAVAHDDTIGVTNALVRQGFKFEEVLIPAATNPITLDKFEKEDVDVTIIVNDGHAEVKLTHNSYFQTVARILFVGDGKVKVEFDNEPF